jgi:hypothetical protein
VFLIAPGEGFARARNTKMYSIAALTPSGTELTDASASRKA